MKKPPARSDQFLDVAYDDQTGEVVIGRVRLRPVSPGCDDLKVRRDYASVVADIVGAYATSSGNAFGRTTSKNTTISVAIRG